MPNISTADREYLVNYISNLAQRLGNPMLMSMLGSAITNDERFVTLRNAFGSLSALMIALAPDVQTETNSKNAECIYVPSMPRRASGEADAALLDGYPMYVNPQDALIKEQTNKMHEFAFMGWWNNTYKQLKRMTGYSGNDSQIWMGIIARQFVQASSKGELIYREFSNENGTSEVCIFRTGLRTMTRKMIVAVLVPNLGAMQPWKLSEYTYAGNTNGTYGMWLLDVVEEQDDVASVMAELRARVWQNLESLNATYQEIQQSLQHLADGYIIDENTQSRVRTYLDSAAKLVRMVRHLPGPSVDYKNKKVSEMFDEIGGTGILAQLKQLEDAIAELLQHIEWVFRTILAQNTSDNSHVIARCRNFLSSAGASIRRGGDPSLYLSDYRKWVELLGQVVGALWEGEAQQPEEFYREFMLSSIMVGILHDHLMKADDEDNQAVQMKWREAENSLSVFEEAILQQQAAETVPQAVPQAAPEEIPETAFDGEAAAFPADDDGLEDIDSEAFARAYFVRNYAEDAANPEQEPETDVGKGDDADDDGPEAAQPEVPEAAPDPVAAAALDRDIVERCKDGELEPETQLLRFCEWKDAEGTVDYSGMNAEEIALGMLTSADMRSEAGMILCLNHSIHQGKLQLSQWLLDSIQNECNRTVYDITVKMQRLIANESTDEKPQLFARICSQMRSIWAELPNCEYSMRRRVTAIILAQIPHMVARYFQIDTVRALFAALDECEWLPEGDLGAFLRQIRTHIEEPNADPAFRDYHLDMTLKLMAVNSLDNRTNTLRRLKEIALRLQRSSVNCRVHFRNARSVIMSFPTAQSPRTQLMLNSLVEGRVLEGATAFESADQMMDYANNQQAVLGFRLSNDIVGSARTSVLNYMKELNDAFRQLCAISTEKTEDNERVLKWYKQIIADLNHWGQLTNTQLNSFPDNELFSYLRSINAYSPLELVWDANEVSAQLYYGDENTNPWPLFREDTRICALMEVSGRITDLDTRDLGTGVLLREESQRRIHAQIDRMLEKCCDLSGQLNEMRHFSAIDFDECSILLEILSCNYGWLQLARQQLDEGAFEHITIPLVRYELEIWYVDRRIEVIFGVVAASVKESVEQHADGDKTEYENLVRQIDDAVNGRDMRFITERFSDAVSSIAYLGEKENLASMFFDNHVMTALMTTIGTESWARQRVNQLAVEGYRQLWTITASNDQIKTVGRAMVFAAEAKDKPLTDERLLRLQELFEFLGFVDPLLTRQDDRLILSASTPDRSICPMPQLGIGIAMRDPTRGNRWCVNYQVRIMKNIGEVNGLFSSAPDGLNEAITILLCPFVISATERKGLLKQAREMASSRNVFLLDKCFLRFAMCLPGTQRLNAFYSCTSSLMRLNPYTVITERQWEGTFFGREGEIDRVIQMGGCHVLYGGRRLGKTSIMREAEFRWLNSGTNRMALYVNLQDIANVDMLWYKVARELSNTIGELREYSNENATEEYANRDARLIVDAISNYLRRNDCYLLLLLDECDELVYRDVIRNSNQERNQGIGRIGDLVKLMNDSQNHCKVVLAGLDRVTRFIRNLNAYSMTWPANYNGYQCFTDSICIRPMLGRDMQNAYDLIDIPFRMLGYRMDRESILYILRVCCFRPNLIQNYCRALLEVVRVRDAVHFEANSLYMHIPYEMVRGIQEGRNAATDYHNQQAEQSIRIPLNVGETAVYAPIAYAVALLSLRNSLKGMFTGFTPQEIFAVINSYNADFAKGLPKAMEYISIILEELVSMGILRSINNPKSTTYALFSNYMMRMLGDDANIEAQLIESLATHIARNRTSSEEIARRELFLERFITEDSFVFPLTSVQLETLNDALKQTGYAIIVGSEMLRISDVSAMFTRIRIDSDTCVVREFGADAFAADGVQRLADCFAECDRVRGERSILILDGGWTREMVDYVAKQWVEERWNCGNVQVVFLARPDMCWAAQEMLLGMPEENMIYLSRVARSFRIGWFNWINAKQRYCFGEDATTVARLSERFGTITGDWPEMIMRFWTHLQSRPYASFDELETEFRDIIHRESRQEILKQLGFDHVDEQIWDVLQLVSREDMTGSEEDDDGNRDHLTDLLELAEDADRMVRTIQYMQMLGLVDIVGDVRQPDSCIVRLDPFAYRMMKGGDER